MIATLNLNQLDQLQKFFFIFFSFVKVETITHLKKRGVIRKAL